MRYTVSEACSSSSPSRRGARLMVFRLKALPARNITCSMKRISGSFGSARGVGVEDSSGVGGEKEEEDGSGLDRQPEKANGMTMSTMMSAVRLCARTFMIPLLSNLMGVVTVRTGL